MQTLKDAKVGSTVAVVKLHGEGAVGSFHSQVHSSLCCLHSHKKTSDISVLPKALTAYSLNHLFL